MRVCIERATKIRILLAMMLAGSLLTVPVHALTIESVSSYVVNGTWGIEIGQDGPWVANTDTVWSNVWYGS